MRNARKTRLITIMRANKLLKAALAVMMALSTSGCVRNLVRGNEEEHIPNENRGTDYDYDFVDYLTITTWGADGDGYLSITARDISASDFKSEQDYIDVSDDLKALGIVFGQTVQNVTASKTSGLSNGDIVTISVGNSGGNKLRTNMNLEDYEYTVSGLGEATQIDLFSSDIVTMYGTRENAMFAYVHNDGSTVPKELTDNLTYSFSANADDYQVGKTIIDASVELNTKFATDNGYSSLTDYLAKHNLAADESTEFVLKEIIDPIDFSNIDSGALMSALYDAISADDPSLSPVCSVQYSTSDNQSVSAYSYMVTYYDLVDNTPVYYRTRAVIHYVGDTFVVQSMDSPQSSNVNSMLQPIQGYEIGAAFVTEDDLNTLAPAADATPEPTPASTTTPSPEATAAPTASASSGITVTQPSDSGTSGSSSSGSSSNSGSSGGSKTIEYYSDDPADYPAGTIFTYDDQGNLTGVYVPDENGDVLLPDN